MTCGRSEMSVASAQEVRRGQRERESRTYWCMAELREKSWKLTLTMLDFPSSRTKCLPLCETYVSSDQILKPSANMGIALLMPSMVYEVRIRSLDSVRLEGALSRKVGAQCTA